MRAPGRSVLGKLVDLVRRHLRSRGQGHLGDLGSRRVVRHAHGHAQPSSGASREDLIVAADVRYHGGPPGRGYVCGP
jgi:hypothetical protein